MLPARTNLNSSFHTTKYFFRIDRLSWQLIKVIWGNYEAAKRIKEQIISYLCHILILWFPAQLAAVVDLLKNFPNNDYLDSRLVSTSSLNKKFPRHLRLIQWSNINYTLLSPQSSVLSPQSSNTIFRFNPWYWFIGGEKPSELQNRVNKNYFIHVLVLLIND